MSLIWTAPADVRSRWVGDAPFPVEDDATLTIVLEDAEDLVLSEFPDLPDRVDNGVPLGRVKRVVSRVVIRYLRNPEGLRTRMETGGPFSENVTFGGEEPGSLFLTAADRADLAGQSEGSGRAFTIDTTPPARAAAAPHPTVDPRLWGDWS